METIFLEFLFFIGLIFFLLPLNFNNSLAEYKIFGSYFFPCILFWHWMLMRDLMLTCFFPFNRWFFFLPQGISLWLWKLITLLGCITVLVVLMIFFLRQYTLSIYEYAFILENFWELFLKLFLFHYGYLLQARHTESPLSVFIFIIFSLIFFI